MKKGNKSNLYVELLGKGAFDKITKAEFAAVAVSYFVNYLNVDSEYLEEEILKEIRVLKENKIIR